MASPYVVVVGPPEVIASSVPNNYKSHDSKSVGKKNHHRDKVVEESTRACLCSGISSRTAAVTSTPLL